MLLLIKNCYYILIVRWSMKFKVCFLPMPAGSGGKCKHILAVIVFVNSEDGAPKTNEPQQWGKPSKVGEKMYNKGKNISDLFPSKRLKLDIKSISHDDLIQHHRVSEISCSLNINLLQEKHSESENPLTCQNVVNFIIENLENQFITENNNIYLEEIIFKQN